MSSWRPICAQNSQLMGESAQAPVDEGRTAGCEVLQGENTPLVQGRGALWTSWEWAGRMGSESESWCIKFLQKTESTRTPWLEKAQDQEAQITGTQTPWALP